MCIVENIPKIMLSYFGYSQGPINEFNCMQVFRYMNVSQETKNVRVTKSIKAKENCM